MSYLIEGLIGPDKTIKFCKSRKGLTASKPFVVHGFFKDEENHGSELELELENKHGFINWKTRENIKKDNRKSVVIVNKNCASSCDIFAAAIKEYKAATLVGTKTAGHVLSGTGYKLSWPGYIAILPTAQITSPMGEMYEGRGVEPDIATQSCDGENNKLCLKEAVKIINSKKFLNN